MLKKQTILLDLEHVNIRKIEFINSLCFVKRTEVFSSYFFLYTLNQHHLMRIMANNKIVVLQHQE